MRQSFEFRASEGADWLERNRDKIEAGIAKDPVLGAIQDSMIPRPTNVLEIGCSNGWRLNELRKRYDCGVWGVDPSGHAVIEAFEKYGIHVYPRDAANLDGKWVSMDDKFDMVIFGFCLYVIDRADYVRVMSEATRVLREGGYLIILDFEKPKEPHSRVYHHKPSLRTYKMDNRGAFLATGIYEPVYSAFPGNEIQVDILRKDTINTFPLENHV